MRARFAWKKAAAGEAQKLQKSQPTITNSQSLSFMIKYGWNLEKLQFLEVALRRF